MTNMKKNYQTLYTSIKDITETDKEYFSFQMLSFNDGTNAVIVESEESSNEFNAVFSNQDISRYDLSDYKNYAIFGIDSEGIKKLNFEVNNNFMNNLYI